MIKCLLILFLLCLLVPFVVKSQMHVDHDFEDGSLGPFNVCTTQNPNYVIAENGRMKTWWTEVGYNGTRMDKGAEACADQIVFDKEGWYGMKFELGADYPNHTSGAIAQVFGFKPGFWSWSGLLEMIDGDLVVIHRRGGGGHTEQVIYPNLPNEQEFDVIVHFVLSAQNQGMFQVWLDGNLIYDAQNISFGMGDFTQEDIQDTANGNYTTFKIGMYNHTDSEYIAGETRTVYYDNVSWYNGGSEGYEIVDPADSNCGALDADERIEAECYSDMEGIEIEACDEGGHNIGFIHSGDWVKFDALDLSGKKSVHVRYASNNAGGLLELRVGSETGTSIGTLHLPATGGWQTWKTDSANIQSIGGIQDVYLVFTGGASYLYNINWIQFSEEELLVTANHKDGLSQAFEVYPNPTLGRIEWSKSGEYMLVSPQGKILDRGIGTDADLSSFQSGMYFLKSQGQNLKVIKN